jgi:hypothetical protein
MYFLNPAILIALSAISIPVIIHLFNLQKIRKVEFSSLMFLKELQKSKIKRIKLKQLLLLLLRIMVIVFLVLSFAKPVYKGYAGAGNVDVKKTVFIYLDNSFSMSATGENGTYLQNSKDAVKKILASHSETDDYYFISSSEIIFKDKKILYSSKKELTDSLENISHSYKTAMISEQLNLASEIFSTSVTQINELYIISDFQRSNFFSPASNIFAGDQFENVNLFLIDAGNRIINNISLDSIEVVSKILEKNREVKMNLVISNNSDFSVSNKIVNLNVNGRIVSEKAIDINSRERKDVEFSFNPVASGYVSGNFDLIRNDLIEDELPEDNKFYFTLFIPEKFKIGIIDESQEGSRYIKLAYAAAHDLMQSGAGDILFDVSTVNINSIIRDYDLLLMTGKRSISREEAELLSAFISDGGGVMIFPGENIDVNSYNDFLSLTGSTKIGALNSNESINSNLRFDKIDFEHPVLSEVFQNRRLSLTREQVQIESPQIKKYYDLFPGEGSLPVITLSNGKPFLISSGYNRGNILISSVSAETSFSNFPVKSIFLPVIIRSTYFLGNNFEQRNDHYIGRSNLIEINRENEISALTDPSGNEKEINTVPGKNNFFNLPYDRFTSEPGIYTLKSNSGGEVNFSLNHDPVESLTDNMDENEIKDFFEKLDFENVFYIAPGSEVTVNISQARTGLELWKYFLLAALMFLALELFLSKRMEKE